MNIQSIFNNNFISTQNDQTKTNISPSQAQQSFSNMLKNAINEVNDAQIQADRLTEKLALGENVELHQVMIAAEKASITLNATMEIRNKVIEAYQEIMRMQV
ncbi:flagellar hook-basal body complex protein FliE [Fervidibacillus halotolerans]|uniref:Flagellar hook-basal body complex protein FliE n=1 Tax=Fervidibacillus halotolerans TaxID=2980027 RepID=A0A9E8S1K0_9BACI|nr:flagellar hook-basal body complex protein FliE [Fervidibacillus halotolerans]WAA13607.1 flagellar hook-basal body complex protein FliE [Fervidibacillus halotolerans]